MKDDIEGKEKANKKITVEFSPTTLWKATTIILAVFFVISLFTAGFGLGGKEAGSQAIGEQQPSPSLQQQGNPQPSQQIIKAALKEDDDFCFGSKDAKVTIFEFSDYQCPFCQRAFQQTFPELKKLADEGKVRYCVKDYPLPFHNEADEAAIAVNCVGLQDKEKYWEMHDILFQKQQEWANNPNAVELFKGYAKTVGVDEAKYSQCMTDESIRKEVEADTAEGSASGVSGTPTFYINGQQLVGAQPSAAFKSIIDAELSK